MDLRTDLRSPALLRDKEFQASDGKKYKWVVIGGIAVVSTSQNKAILWSSPLNAAFQLVYKDNEEECVAQYILPSGTARPAGLRIEEEGMEFMDEIVLIFLYFEFKKRRDAEEARAAKSAAQSAKISDAVQSSLS